MRLANLLVVSLAAAAVNFTLAQSAGPAFEVASVKVNVSRSPFSFGPGIRGDTLHAENVTMRALLQSAYNVQMPQIIGSEYLDIDRFDIEAKAPEGTAPSQLMPMLQTLLKDRFRVTVHREVRQVRSYEMVEAKGGLKLHLHQPGQAPEPPSQTGGANMSGNGTMQRIAQQLARVAGVPIVDKTGIEGNFSFSLTYAPQSLRVSDSGPDFGPLDFFAAVEQQLGLRLIPGKPSVEVLLVDHAERVPTVN